MLNALTKKPAHIIDYKSTEEHQARSVNFTCGHQSELCRWLIYRHLLRKLLIISLACFVFSYIFCHFFSSLNIQMFMSIDESFWIQNRYTAKKTCESKVFMSLYAGKLPYGLKLMFYMLCVCLNSLN